MSSNESSHWQFHLDQIEQEGISTKAYAAREGLSLQSLYQWRHELKRRRSDDPVSLAITPRAPRKFVQMSVVPEEENDQQPANCCLVLPSGLRLEMSALPSPRWFAELAQVLGGLSTEQR